METDLIPYNASNGIPAQAVLVLAPHPDDEVFGCGGAIARHVRAGQTVCVVILTDGALFGDPVTRAQESTEAGQVLGYGAPEFWNFPDRGLHYSEALVLRLVDKITRTGADLIYAPSPWEVHPDHRQTHMLAVEAVRRSAPQAQIAFYEVGTPLRPNSLLDITPVLETKHAALRCFASQLAQQNYAGHIHALNQFRTYTLAREVLAAEAFWLLTSHELEQITSIGLLVGVSPGLQGVPALARREVPLVSILIRSMDREYLAETLDSVALQTYPHLEVVVVAARPEHRPIPSKCGPFNVRLLQTTTALQRSQAANKAMAQARGELFLFLDDDDWLMPGHIARLAQTLARQPHALAVYTGISVVDADGHPKGQAFDLPFDAVRQMAGNLTPIHAVLFRANVLLSGCRFDESLDLYEDWDFWLQVARLAPMVHLPGVSGAYRIHESSGVHIDAGPEGAAAATIYRKWASEWTPEQLGQMMQRVWSHPELEVQLTNANQLLAHAQQDLAGSKLQMAETHQLLTDSGLQLAETQQGLLHTKQELADKAGQLADTNLLLADTRLDLAQTVLRLTATTAKLAEADEQLRTAAKLQAQLQEVMAQQQLQIDLQTQEIETINNALARQRHDHAALLASHSWRITKPLRQLAELTRASPVGRIVRAIRRLQK